MNSIAKLQELAAFIRETPPSYTTPQIESDSTPNKTAFQCTIQFAGYTYTDPDPSPNKKEACARAADHVLQKLPEYKFPSHLMPEVRDGKFVYVLDCPSFQGHPSMRFASDAFSKQDQAKKNLMRKIVDYYLGAEVQQQQQQAPQPQMIYQQQPQHQPQQQPPQPQQQPPQPQQQPQQPQHQQQQPQHQQQQPQPVQHQPLPPQPVQPQQPTQPQSPQPQPQQHPQQPQPQPQQPTSPPPQAPIDPHLAHQIKAMLTNWLNSNQSILCELQGVGPNDAGEAQKMMPLAFLDSSFFQTPAHEEVVLSFCGVSKAEFSSLKPLGEAVLHAAVLRHLYHHPEGADTNTLRERLMSVESCSKYLKKMNVDQILIQRDWAKPFTDKMRADAFVTLLGVLFIIARDKVFEILAQCMS